MPLLRARDAILPIASHWDAAQPPAFPICVNISNGLPSSSSLIVTYRFPQPVFTFLVAPKVTSPLGLGVKKAGTWGWGLGAGFSDP